LSLWEVRGSTGGRFLTEYLGVHPDQLKTCPADQHDFEPTSEEDWSWDGMHVLADGDQLTIFDKNDTTVVVWSGAIRLRSYEPYTEKALDCWIHADQEGVEREIWARWFFDRYPAQLEPANRKVATTQRFTLSLRAAAEKRAPPKQRRV
jgi:hypothetical protein